MADVLVWVMERRVVLEERVEQLRKDLAETEAEVARLEAAEVVIRQYLADREAGHPGQDAWEQALEEATGGGGASAPAAPGAGGMLLVPHRTEGMGVEALPEAYQRLMTIGPHRAGGGQGRSGGAGQGEHTGQSGAGPRSAAQTRRTWLAGAHRVRALPATVIRVRQRGRTVRLWAQRTGSRRKLGLGVKKQSQPAEGPSGVVHQCRLPLSNATVNLVAGLLRGPPEEDPLPLEEAELRADRRDRPPPPAARPAPCRPGRRPPRLRLHGAPLGAGGHRTAGRQGSTTGPGTEEDRPKRRDVP